MNFEIREDVRIYVIKDPEDDYVFYVGQTSTGLLQRMQAHITNCSARNATPMKKFMGWLLRQGRKPVIEVVDTCGVEQRHIVEQRWIDHYLNLGYNLFNIKVTGRPGKTKSKYSILQ